MDINDIFMHFSSRLEQIIENFNFLSNGKRLKKT